MSIFNKKNYVAAISGGPDSIALLNMYHKHIKVVCVVKYNKRIDCQKDVDCVVKLCNKHKINYELLNVDKKIYDKYKYLKNFQTIARAIRYDFFYEIAKKYNAKKILVAHHLDDFLETAYLDLIKKSKKLFYGIKQKSSYKDLEIYRPFLNKYRKETLKRYCDDLNLNYAIDSSNFEDIYERNKIRKIIKKFSKKQIYDLLLKIKKYNKKHKKLKLIIDKLFINWKKENFSIIFLKKVDEKYWYYLLFYFLKQNSIYRPNQNKINGIISFIKANSKNKFFRLENKLFLIKQDNKLNLIQN